MMHGFGAAAFFAMTIAFASGITLADDKEPRTYVELLNRMQERTCWLGKQYTYRFKMDHLTAGMTSEHCYPIMLEGTRVLEVGTPKPGSTVVPYRVTQTLETTTEPGAEDGKLVTFWEASDGRQTRRFCRFLVADKCEATPQHTGFVTAGPSAHFANLDPFKILLGYGGSALGGMLGISPQVFKEEDFEGQPMTLTVRDHPKFGKCFIRGDGNSFGLVLSAPEYLLLGGSPTGEPGTFDFQIDDLVEYDGIRYPKSGTYESTSKTGSFELIKVENFDLAPEDTNDWFPSWPSGTTILDYETGATTRIPFEAEEMAEYEQRLRDNCSPLIAQSENRWFLWLNAILLLGLIAYWAYRWRRRAS
ncbi:hypothetical protein [Allorhodopirellula heiligendammensis]|nr:hypothetical protein [Allorhodopirellula heiligendammensis]